MIFAECRICFKTFLVVGCLQNCKRLRCQFSSWLLEDIRTSVHIRRKNLEKDQLLAGERPTTPRWDKHWVGHKLLEPNENGFLRYSTTYLRLINRKHLRHYSRVRNQVIIDDLISSQGCINKGCTGELEYEMKKYSWLLKQECSIQKRNWWPRDWQLKRAAKEVIFFSSAIEMIPVEMSAV